MTYRQATHDWLRDQSLLLSARFFDEARIDVGSHHGEQTLWCVRFEKACFEATLAQRLDALGPHRQNRFETSFARELATRIGNRWERLLATETLISVIQTQEDLDTAPNANANPTDEALMVILSDSSATQALKRRVEQSLFEVANEALKPEAVMISRGEWSSFFNDARLELGAEMIAALITYGEYSANRTSLTPLEPALQAHLRVQFAPFLPKSAL